MTARRLKVMAGFTLLAIAALFVLLPIYWVIVASTKSTSVLFSSNTFVPSGFASLGRNISTLFTFQGGLFRYWIVNSVAYSLVTACLVVYVASLTGYALAKFKFVGRGALLATIIGSLMVPASVLIIPLFILERSLRMSNSYEGVILPLIVAPFVVYFMSFYADGAVPTSLIEAARVDGAHELKIFHKIALPAMAPGVVTMFLITFIGTWNNYFLPLVLLQSGDKYPMTVGISIWFSDIHAAGVTEPLYPEVILGSLVSVLPMLLMFPFLQRYVARGLTLGALAGQ
jgi:multiple sugar transport system permease protein